MCGAGLVVLNYLSENATRTLEVLLGIVILASAATMMLRPQPIAQLSSAGMHFFVGTISGFFERPVWCWWAAGRASSLSAAAIFCGHSHHLASDPRFYHGDSAQL